MQVALRTLAAPVLALNLDEQCEAALSHMVSHVLPAWFAANSVSICNPSLLTVGTSGGGLWVA